MISNSDQRRILQHDHCHFIATRLVCDQLLAAVLEPTRPSSESLVKSSWKFCLVKVALADYRHWHRFLCLKWIYNLQKPLENSLTKSFWTHVLHLSLELGTPTMELKHSIRNRHVIYGKAYDIATYCMCSIYIHLS